MELRSSPSIQTKQGLAITSGMIQSIQLLQFQQDDLIAYLREQEKSNPLIEIVESAVDQGKKSSTKDQERGGSISTRNLSSGSGLGSSTQDAIRSLEETHAESVTLREHLLRQVGEALKNSEEIFIANEIVESIEPDGYMRGDLDEIAEALDIDIDRVEHILKLVQQFDPVGVGARDLAECLRIQMRESGGLTAEMKLLLDNLPLLGQAKIEELAKLCSVTPQEIAQMGGVIRNLEPRPGLNFDTDPIIFALPDVKVEFQADGGFHVELNTDLLPKVLIDQEYYAEIQANSKGTDDVRFVMDCMKDANWIVRNLDQRAKTILKVTTEIIRQQKAFFVNGSAQIKPLSQGDVAEAVGVHRSTVCRATSGKYVLVNRGMFELNYFFSNALNSADGDADHSAESVRAKIRVLIETETAKTVLSDDAIMKALRKEGVEVARRTVAKYREMINIPSSQVRKRLKRVENVERDVCPA